MLGSLRDDKSIGNWSSLGTAIDGGTLPNEFIGFLFT
jgi:hypothetical protein